MRSRPGTLLSLFCSHFLFSLFLPPASLSFSLPSLSPSLPSFPSLYTPPLPPPPPPPARSSLLHSTSTLSLVASSLPSPLSIYFYTYVYYPLSLYYILFPF